MKEAFISKKCLYHSNIGAFYKKGRQIKQKSGGHGEGNISFLKQRRIPYSITKKYENGVRLGNISIHKRAKNRERGLHCWFPESWKQRDIEKAGKHVLSLKKNKKRVDQIPLTGTYKKVKVGLYTKNGFAQTIFPWFFQKGGKK